MKKFWIILSVVLLILALTVLIVSRFSSQSEIIESMDQESRYPYFLRRTEDGLSVTVTGEFPQGAAWRGKSLNSSIVSVRELKQDGKKATFSLTPVSWGSGRVALLLELDGEQLYALEIDLTVGTDNSIALSSAGHSELCALSGETEQYAFSLTPTADGGLTLRADHAADCDWFLRVDGGNVAAQPVSELLPEAETDFAEFTLTALQPGEDTVRLCSEALGQAVVFPVTVDEGGRLSVSDYEIVPFAPEENRLDQECLEAYRALMGEPQLPTGARLSLANAILRPSRKDSAKILDAGLLQFWLMGREWTLYVTDDGTADDLSGDRSALEETSQTVEENGLSAKIYSRADGCFALWQSASGRSWMLESEGAPAEDLAAVTEKLLQVVN